jgi:predicted DNA-binding transcriptional regulator AlpA
MKFEAEKHEIAELFKNASESEALRAENERLKAENEALIVLAAERDVLKAENELLKAGSEKLKAENEALAAENKALKKKVESALNLKRAGANPIVPPEILEKWRALNNHVKLIAYLGCSPTAFYKYRREGRAPKHVIEKLSAYFTETDAAAAPVIINPHTTQELLNIPQELLDKLSSAKNLTPLIAYLGCSRSSFFNYKKEGRAPEPIIEKLTAYFLERVEDENKPLKQTRANPIMQPKISEKPKIEKAEKDGALPEWISNIKEKRMRDLVEQEYYCDPKRAQLFATFKDFMEIQNFKRQAIESTPSARSSSITQWKKG